MRMDDHEIEAIADSVLAKIVANRELVLEAKPDPIGFCEKDAASLIGVSPHVLRDARLRGEIKARKIGRTAVFSRQALIDWVEAIDQ